MYNVDFTRENEAFLDQFSYEIYGETTRGAIVATIPKDELALMAAYVHNLCWSANHLYDPTAYCQDPQSVAYRIGEVVDRGRGEWRPANRNMAVRIGYPMFHRDQRYREHLNSQTHRTVTIENRNKFEDRTNQGERAYFLRPNEVVEHTLRTISLRQTVEMFKGLI